MVCMQPAAQRQPQHNFTAHPKRKPPRAAKAQMRHSMVLLQAACQQCMPLSICASSCSTPAVLDDQKCDCPACAKALLRICTASKGPKPWVALGRPSAQPADSVMLPTHSTVPTRLKLPSQPASWLAIPRTSSRWIHNTTRRCVTDGSQWCVTAAEPTHGLPACEVVSLQHAMLLLRRAQREGLTFT
jgi:hypothetical protein